MAAVVADQLLRGRTSGSRCVAPVACAAAHEAVGSLFHLYRNKTASPGATPKSLPPWFDFGVLLTRLRVPLAGGRSLDHVLPDRQLQEKVVVEHQLETMLVVLVKITNQSPAVACCP